MTESIFAPFVIDTEEGVKKVLEVLEGEASWPNNHPDARLLSPEEGLEFLRNREKRRNGKA